MHLLPDFRPLSSCLELSNSQSRHAPHHDCLLNADAIALSRKLSQRWRYHTCMQHTPTAEVACAPASARPCWKAPELMAAARAACTAGTAEVGAVNPTCTCAPGDACTACTHLSAAQPMWERLVASNIACHGYRQSRTVYYNRCRLREDAKTWPSMLCCDWHTP